MRFVMIAGDAGTLTNFRGPLLKALLARGHEVHAAAPGLGTGSSEADQLRAWGVRPHNVPMNRTGLSPLADLRSLIALIRLLKRLSPDAMMGYTIKPAIWGTIAAWIAGVPRRVALIPGLGLSFNEGDGAKQRLLMALVSAMYRTALRRAETVVFQNRDDLALFRDRSILDVGARTQVVDGSGVDLDHFTRAPLPDGPLHFVLVARMIASKGVREFAEAARQTRKRHPLVQFDLIGGLDSNPDSVTASELNAFQAEQVLTWHGQVSDVRPLMRAAHVVVLPSYYREGVPRSLLEALALGRLIITTDMPGCRETLDRECNGILIPPRDAGALARAMDRLVRASRGELLAMSEASYRLATERFDVRKVNQDMIAVIEGEPTTR
jgi:glycosyltransferase involved in cell wall biosynthesis